MLGTGLTGRQRQIKRKNKNRATNAARVHLKYYLPNTFNRSQIVLLAAAPFSV